jgi:hypothetical protein
MGKKTNRVDLKKIFINLQEQMATKLSANRKLILHPGTKGDASELNWIRMLDTYLPKRYKVDKAFVLDSDGNLSDQIDLVIYDRQYSPFLFNQDGALYIPAESVYAVFEVKQTLNKDMMLYAGGKIESVRKLKRTTAPIYHAAGIYKPKKHFEILGGILTLGSDWTHPFGDSFRASLKILNSSQRINLGCALQTGGFEVKYAKNMLVHKSDRYDSLIFFFLRLLASLQQRGTVPAIDISQYGKVI